MSDENDGQGGNKLRTLHRGTVVDNADPLKLGRVRVIIPGRVEPASPWALPLGGGGKKRRGAFAPPDVGADVAVLFFLGDQDHPHYIGGHYGNPAGGIETPGPVGGYHGADEPEEDISPADAPKVKAWEGDRYIVVCDERPGKERLLLRDKKTDDEIEFDGVRHGITIKATTALRLLATGAIDIQGAIVTINGRPVSPSAKPIE